MIQRLTPLIVILLMASLSTASAQSLSDLVASCRKGNFPQCRLALTSMDGEEQFKLAREACLTIGEEWVSCDVFTKGVFYKNMGTDQDRVDATRVAIDLCKKHRDQFCLTAGGFIEDQDPDGARVLYRLCAENPHGSGHQIRSCKSRL